MSDTEFAWVLIGGGVLVWIFTKPLVAASERTRIQGFGGRREGKSAKAWSSFSTATTRLVGTFFIVGGLLVLFDVIPVARTR